MSLNEQREISPVQEENIIVKKSILGKKWVLKDCSEHLTQTFIQKLNIPDSVARVLATKGVALEESTSFLSPTLKAYLKDPFHLKDMEKAAYRVVEAIKNQEKIAVFGDYDVDGATSSALLYSFLNIVYDAPIIYIPDRFLEGYGPNSDAFLKLKDQGVNLIITLDCGTTSFDPIETANQHNMDVIIIDHHVSESLLPKAHSIVNPNRLDENSPLTYLAAVGVTFLFIIAINSLLRKNNWYSSKPEPNLLQWLDLVALGTVCDIVPLKDLNRALVSQGLKIMKLQRNIGLKALAKTFNLQEAPSTYHSGFMFGPRINAGGRVGESNLGSKLLTTKDEQLADEISLKLDRYNRERQQIEEKMLQEAFDSIDAKQVKKDNMIVLAQEGWHPGVIGIVASRLVEKFYCPTFVIAIDEDGIGKGSGRSIKDFDLGSAVIAAKQAGFLINGGGHKMAAGLTIANEQLEAFKSFLNSRIQEQTTSKNFIQSLNIDTSISVKGVNLDLLKELEKLSPFGMGNPEPKFLIKNVFLKQVKIVGEKHIKCDLTDIRGGYLQSIAFRSVDNNLGHYFLNQSNTPFDLVGTLKINSWQGYEKPQFIIQDAFPSQEQDICF